MLIDGLPCCLFTPTLTLPLRGRELSKGTGEPADASPVTVPLRIMSIKKLKEWCFLGLSVRSFALLAVLALLLSAFLATAGLAPAGVSAAGGETRVVGTSQHVNYPSGVEVGITIESDIEIKEVRVYYRAAGSRQWGYAYADFEPGSRIVATQSVPVQESTYIAPGADVEYYFEVRSIEGKVIKTHPAVVEYLDDRFDWRRVQIGPLELVYHDIRESRIEDYARVLREDLARVQELLQLEQVRDFKGVIYNSYDDANAAFPVTSQTTTDHGTFAGYAFPEQRVFVGQGLNRRIIVHESTHLMFRDALGPRNVEVPAWLNEGFATYMEPDVRVRSSSDLYARTPHLRAMTSLSGTPETIPLFYQKSVSVVAHLIGEYGEDEFRLLLREIGRGTPSEVALVSVYGFDDHGLDSSWAGLPIPPPAVAAPRPRTPAQAALSQAESEQGHEAPADAPNPGDSSSASPSGEGRVEGAPQSQPPAAPQQGNGQSPQRQAPAERNEPSPFIFFDAWILAGVALLALAVGFAKFVYNRLRQSRDPADNGWESWYDDNED